MTDLFDQVFLENYKLDVAIQGFNAPISVFRKSLNKNILVQTLCIGNFVYRN